MVRYVAALACPVIDRHLALRSLRPIHLSHPALPEGRKDLEDAEAGSGGEGHG